jgi:RNA polymerase sigma factor (TIGR02999 family)
MAQDAAEITRLLMAWRRGDAAAGDAVIARVYPELRRLAARYLRQQPKNHTLQPTEVVHELYLRLLAPNPITLQDRAHFFAIAAQQLRRILIDYARAAKAEKRGGEQVRVTFADVPRLSANHNDDLLAVDEALTRLEEVDPRAARVVELRFFGGLQDKEAAQTLHVSVATVKRDWAFARAWLSAQLMPSAAAAPTVKT